MSKCSRFAGIPFILVAVFLLACAPKAAPPPVPQSSAPAPAAAPARPAPVSAAPARPSWQDEWDRTLAAGKQEGRVSIYTTAGGAIPVTMMKIASMQGLKAEVTSVRTAEFLTKITNERRAGLYLTDISLGGPQPILNTAKPAGLMETLDSAFILPHLTDPEEVKRTWYNGAIPWADKEHTVLIIALQPGTAITVNTELVKPDELKSWKDVFSPKWNGKVAFSDPTIAGYGAMAVQAMANIMGEDYVRQLAAAKPLVIRDQRQLVEWLARGKLAVAIAAAVEVIVEFMQAGAPIKVVLPQEGTWLGPGNAGGVDWFKNSPHPNASKVFLNWLTSKEGQEVFAVAGGFHSTRVDVSTAHLLPGLARTEGAKYFPAYTEENYLKRPDSDKWAKDLFGPLIK